VSQNRSFLAVGTRIILTLCTPLVLLLSNLYVLATPAFIRYEYGKPTFPAADLYSDKDRLSLAEATLYYMRSDKGVDYLTSLEIRGRAVYNPREIWHLVDAKWVLRGALVLHAACAILGLLALALTWRRKEDRSGALRAMFWGCAVLVGTLVGIGLLAYTNFRLFFTIFHRLLFEGDSWLFDFSDTLIQLFPVTFWMDATWLLSILAVVECTLLGALALITSRKLKAQR
jgi:integral membrane protein (TIGR01906 family)